MAMVRVAYQERRGNSAPNPRRKIRGIPQPSRKNAMKSCDRKCPRRLARRHRPRWFLRLRELIVQFAVAHRSDQNVDDSGDLVQRGNGDGILTLLELNRFRS